MKLPSVRLHSHFMVTMKSPRPTGISKILGLIEVSTVLAVAHDTADMM